MEDREPIFNVPAGVLAVLAVLIAVHVALSLMTEDQFTWWVLALAFIPARYSGLAAQLPGGEPAVFTSFVTHMAVHAELIHLAFNSLWLLAFGSVLCMRIGSLRFLTFSISGGIAGALLFLALNPGLAAPVIGASGAVSAMMGGVMHCSPSKLTDPVVGRTIPIIVFMVVDLPLALPPSRQTISPLSIL